MSLTFFYSVPIPNTEKYSKYTMATFALVFQFINLYISLDFLQLTGCVCACLVERGRAAGDLNAVFEPADGGAGLRRRRTRGLQAGVAFAAPRLRGGRASEPRHEVHLQVNPRHLALQK